MYSKYFTEHTRLRMAWLGYRLKDEPSSVNIMHHVTLVHYEEPQDHIHLQCLRDRETSDMGKFYYINVS